MKYHGFLMEMGSKLQMTPWRKTNLQSNAICRNESASGNITAFMMEMGSQLQMTHRGEWIPNLIVMIASVDLSHRQNSLVFSNCCEVD